MIIMKITLEYSLINTEYNENPEIIEMTNIHVHVQTDLQTNKQADSPRPCSSGRINAVNSQLISNIWQGLLGLRINSSSHDYSLYPEQITIRQIYCNLQEDQLQSIKATRWATRERYSLRGGNVNQKWYSQPDCVSATSLFQKKTRVTNFL